MPLTDDALAAAAKALGTSPEMMRTTQKTRYLARARRVFVLVMRQMSDASYPRIGCAMAKHHTTAMKCESEAHAIDREIAAGIIAELRKTYPNVVVYEQFERPTSRPVSQRTYREPRKHDGKTFDVPAANKCPTGIEDCPLPDEIRERAAAVRAGREVPCA